jgi:ketosteroid isomerase-like protein
MTLEDLENYSAAWNAHDIDTLMAYMTDDCIFETCPPDQNQ